MYIILYFLSIIVIQVYLLIIAIKSGQKTSWKDLLFIEIISAISIIPYNIIYYCLNNIDSIRNLGLFIISILGLPFLILFFIVSIIIFVILYRKLLNDSKISSFSRMFLVLALLFTITLALDIKPFFKEKARQKEYSNYIIDYLNNRYGESNYKINDIYNSDDCYFMCINPHGGDYYRFDVSSDYFDENFSVEISIDSKKIVDDDFLEEYAISKNLCNGDYYGEECLEKLVTEKIENSEPNIKDYKANITVSFDTTYGKTMYGRIPTIDDLSEEAIIEFESFTIYKDFTDKNEEEFKNFMLDVYYTYKNHYQKYKTTKSDMIEFDFPNGNPFAEGNIHYKDGGYMREAENSLLIYGGAKPFIVDLTEQKNI